MIVVASSHSKDLRKILIPTDRTIHTRLFASFRMERLPVELVLEILNYFADDTT
jgi:hypothetical protein